MRRHNLGFFGSRAKSCIVIALIFIVLSITISVFNSFFNYFQFFEYQAKEVEKLFDGRKDFNMLAKDLLNTRSDIAYIKLLDKNGIMIDSLGRESFIQMVDQLRRREEATKETHRFQPTVIVSENKEEAKIRRVTAFVAKISDFENLSSRLSTSEFSSFLTEYRKAASSIVSDYGGVIEALLQDEIVALFNVPDEQDKPELRAVCAAVEVLQVLANMSRKRMIQGKEAINGKIGIGAKAVPFYVESGIPQGVKDVVTLARGICQDAPLWKVLVSSEVYKLVSDYVDAKEVDVEHGTSFSIVAVEEGVIQV